MKKLIYSIICSLFLLTLSNVVSAQGRPHAFYVTPYIGSFVFDVDQNLDNDPVYGISLGYNFTKYLGVEAAGGYIDTKYDLPVSYSRVTKVINYRMDGIFNLLPDDRLVPFIFISVGGQRIDYPSQVSNKNSSAAAYGGGVRFFFTDDLALRGDARRIYVFDDSMIDMEFSLGLSFYFGGAKAAPVPIAEPIKAEEKVVIMAAEPKVEEKVMLAAVEPKIIILAFEDIHFDFDKATLKPEAQSILKRNIQLLKANPNAQIRIAGYTSAAGAEDYNQSLSERRANAVQEYLINEGIISRDRLSMIGYGETRPAMPEAAPKELYSTAAKANMRVLFEIIVK